LIPGGEDRLESIDLRDFIETVEEQPTATQRPFHPKEGLKGSSIVAGGACHSPLANMEVLDEKRQGSASTTR
jgi:hypothetical protein